MKAIFHTYNLEKMHFKCFNLTFKYFKSLNLNTWPFWFKISYEFLLNVNIFNIVENLSSGLSNLNFKMYLNLQSKRRKYAILKNILLNNVF